MGRNILKNEQGVALVIALLMLLVLTLIGISSITSTTFEANISGNERVGTEAFYTAEAGVQEAINQLPNTNPIPRKKLGNDSYYWSGGPKDKEGNEQPMKFIGFYIKPGYDTYVLKRYQINITGESSLGANKEIEVQAIYYVPPGTQY
jgi:hypothetical protein